MSCTDGADGDLLHYGTRPTTVDKLTDKSFSSWVKGVDDHRKAPSKLLSDLIRRTNLIVPLKAMREKWNTLFGATCRVFRLW